MDTTKWLDDQFEAWWAKTGIEVSLLGHVSARRLAELAFIAGGASGIEHARNLLHGWREEALMGNLAKKPDDDWEPKSSE